eukprot:TRINITY_DN6599_c0_g1_i1.p1 TRINITY_DN6599_c0_g1~~TRINITY_DN6599_c0_g1_i1.p1  ORF type:complete len:179 (-),score=22.26 TRINITY_DN6599_c0_g1_i1:1158-1694(-)
MLKGCMLKGCNVMMSTLSTSTCTLCASLRCCLREQRTRLLVADTTRTWCSSHSTWASSSVPSPELPSRPPMAQWCRCASLPASRESFGVDERNVPTVVIAEMMGGSINKYLFGGGCLSKGSIQYFRREYYNGNLKPYFKSEELATEDLAAPVKVVKGKTFKPIVIDTDKDVIIIFYAP